MIWVKDSTRLNILNLNVKLKKKTKRSKKEPKHGWAFKSRLARLCLVLNSFYFLKGRTTILFEKKANNTSHVDADDVSSASLSFSHHYGDRKIRAKFFRI